MSASPYFFIEYRDREKEEWVPVILYTKRSFSPSGEGKMNPVDVWNYNGTHTLFGLLGGERGDRAMSGVHYGMPFDVSKHVKEEYKGFEEYDVSVHYTYLSNLYIEMLKHPTIKDYDYEGEEAEVESPIIDFFNRVSSYVELWDDFIDVYSELSDIRIVYWLSY